MNLQICFLTPCLSGCEDDGLLAVERLPRHDGRERGVVDVREPLGGEGEFGLSVDHLPAAFHQRRLAEKDRLRQEETSIPGRQTCLQIPNASISLEVSTLII